MDDAPDEREASAPSVGELLPRLFRGVPLGTYLIVLILYVLLEWLLLKITFLPSGSYFRPSITWETVRHLPQLPWRLLPLFAILGLMAWRWRSAGEGWMRWEGGGAARSLGIVAAGLVAWPFVTYEYNSYLDQRHLADRLLLAALFAGVCWRPVFLWPFLVVSVAIGGQFFWPLGNGSYWVFADMAFRVLILLGAFQLFSVVTGRRSIRPFLFLAGCVMVAHYWPSGWSKLRSMWLLHDHVPYLLTSTYPNGWWAGVSGESIGKVTNTLLTLNPVMKVFALAAECGVLFLFFRRWGAMVLLGMLIALHSGIFLISGICFWQWALLELCFLLLVWRSKPFREGGLFSFGSFATAFVIIFFAKFWLDPVKLTWFDARATYTYRYEGTGQSGERYLLAPRFFAPYEDAMTIGQLRSLSKHPVLQITWGATNRKIADRLHRAETAEAVLEVERDLGEVYHDPATEEMMTNFLRQFLAGIHEEQAIRSRSWFSAPRRIWTFPEEGEYRYQEPLAEVEVVQVLTFFDGKTVRTVRRTPVLTVDLQAPDP